MRIRKTISVYQKITETKNPVSISFFRNEDDTYVMTMDVHSSIIHELGWDLETTKVSVLFGINIDKDALKIEPDTKGVLFYKGESGSSTHIRLVYVSPIVVRNIVFLQRTEPNTLFHYKIDGKTIYIATKNVYKYEKRGGLLPNKKLETILEF